MSDAANLHMFAQSTGETFKRLWSENTDNKSPLTSIAEPKTAIYP